ncbi:hypothetical protein D3C75_1132540 [compost metagenome]
MKEPTVLGTVFLSSHFREGYIHVSFFTALDVDGVQFTVDDQAFVNTFTQEFEFLELGLNILRVTFQQHNVLIEDCEVADHITDRVLHGGDWFRQCFVFKGWIPATAQLVNRFLCFLNAITFGHDIGQP